METVNVVLFKRSKSAKTGIIKIRITKARKSVYHSLNITLAEKYWNSNTGFVKRVDTVDHEAINTKIKAELKRLEIIDHDTTYLSKDKSFLQYYKQQLDLIEGHSHGTFKGKQIVYNLLVTFVTQQGKNDLYFKEIDESFVVKFRNYLKTKGLANITYNKYLTRFKSVLNSAIKNNQYNYLRHPFLNIQISRMSDKKEYLTLEEVVNIMQCQDPKILETRLYFLFSIYAQGMRVSDLLLLRWSDITDNRMSYVMHKTKKLMNVNINAFMLEYLEPFVFKALPEEARKDIEECKADCTRTLSPEEIKEVKKKVKVSIELFIKETREVALKAYTISMNYYLRWLRDVRPDSFVFGLLDADLFAKFDIYNVTKKQYNNIASRTTLYNRSLKTLAESCGIKKNLSSHIARHTYSNLMLSLPNSDLYAISKSLGHTHISITEAYLSSFNVTKVDNATIDLVNMVANFRDKTNE